MTKREKKIILSGLLFLISIVSILIKGLGVFLSSVILGTCVFLILSIWLKLDTKSFKVFKIAIILFLARIFFSIGNYKFFNLNVFREDHGYSTSSLDISVSPGIILSSFLISYAFFLILKKKLKILPLLLFVVIAILFYYFVPAIFLSLIYGFD